MSNLSGNCVRCLCYASTLCNATVGCSRGYCGPYYLHRDYWKDAGQPVLHDDDPDRDQAFVDCAVDAGCALKAVENYMAKWGRVSVFLISYLTPSPGTYPRAGRVADATPQAFAGHATSGASQEASPLPAGHTRQVDGGTSGKMCKKQRGANSTRVVLAGRRDGVKHTNANVNPVRFDNDSAFSRVNLNVVDKQQ